MRSDQKLSISIVAVVITLTALIVVPQSYSLPSKNKTGFSCRRWLELDQPTKVALIQGIIKLAHEDNVEIRLSPEYYVKEIDSLIHTYLATDNEEALDTSLGATFRTIAVMDGDWDNGEPKLEQAKKWLGPFFYSLEELYPEKYRNLLRDE